MEGEANKLFEKSYQGLFLLSAISVCKQFEGVAFLRGSVGDVIGVG